MPQFEYNRINPIAKCSVFSTGHFLRFSGILFKDKKAVTFNFCEATAFSVSKSYRTIENAVKSHGTVSLWRDNDKKAQKGSKEFVMGYAFNLL